MKMKMNKNQVKKNQEINKRKKEKERWEIFRM